MNELKAMMIGHVEEHLSNLTEKELDALGLEVAISLIRIASNPNLGTDTRLKLEECQLTMLLILIRLRIESKTLN